MNSGKREDILGRIREALRIPAPRAHNGTRAGAAESPGEVQPRAWLPAVPPDAEGQLALFQKNCAQLRTDLQLVAGAKEAAETLASLRDAADALRCQLVYALVPKSGSIHDLAEQGARMKAAENVRAVEHSMALEDQAVGGIEDKIEEKT